MKLKKEQIEKMIKSIENFEFTEEDVKYIPGQKVGFLSIESTLLLDPDQLEGLAE